MSFLSENALDPTVFPSVLRFENELVAMAASHLNGDDEVVGNFTSGGTESIMLAVKTARDYARAVRPEVREPEMVLPVTAHAAFQKAGHYLGVQAGAGPGRPEDVQGRRRRHARGDHAEHDPARGLGRLLRPRGRRSDPRARDSSRSSRNLLLHVDACMGGFLLPYFRRLGAPVPDFDFSVPGVTSMSMDLHKYAFAAKGASTVLYRNKELRKYQIYTCAQWTGYTIINPTVQSTKSAGPLAAAWAVLNFLGDDGYLENRSPGAGGDAHHRRRHRQDGRPAPSRSARNEPGGLHLGHRERLPHHRRDESSAAGTSSRSSGTAARRRTSTCPSTRRASAGSTPC